MSVAGKRAGLAGERSGLFMEQIRIVKEMRERDIRSGSHFSRHPRPRYMVWENVCFDADTLVACETGYTRIADVSVGTKVKTLNGRYMPVAKVHKTLRQKVLKLSVSGGEDLYVTPNHPFYVREKTYPHGLTRQISEPKWMRAGDLTDKCLIAYRVDVPTLPDDFISESEAYAVGRWLADGSVDLKKSTPRIFISCGLKKADDTYRELSRLPYEVYQNRVHATAVNFCFTSHEFYSLIRDAGVEAGNKEVPPFVFELPIKLQTAVLDGYTCGDGYIRTRGNCTEFTASTASRKLAYGIARLVRNVHRVTANISVSRPKNGLISGRMLHANHPSYKVTATLTSKVTTGYDDGEFIWQPVKSIEREDGKRTVYNLSVYEDNTYGANDVVVHNCGAFSSNKGKDFQAVLSEIIKIVEPEADDVPMPEKDKWPHAGCLYDEMGRWSVAWRVHDAQFWGVPQRRKRIALVADFGGLTAPEVLFERKSMQWDPPESGTQGQGTSTGTENRPDSTINDRSGNAGRGRINQSDVTVYNGESVTSATNKSNPQPGDPCHTLTTDSRNYLVGDEAVGFGETGVGYWQNGIQTLRAEGENRPSRPGDVVVTNEPDKCLTPWEKQQKRVNPPGGIADALCSADKMWGGPSTLVFDDGTRSESPGKCLTSWDVQSKRVFPKDGTVGTLNSGTSEGMNIVPCVLDEKDGPGKCLNPWDVQSKHIQPQNGISESLYAGECRYGGGESYVLQEKTMCYDMDNERRRGPDEFEEQSPTLTSRAGTGGNNVPCVTSVHESAEPTPAIEEQQVICMATQQGGAEIRTDDGAPTLTAAAGMSGNNQPVICMATSQGGAEIRTDDGAPTLTAMAGTGGNNQPVICIQGNVIDRADTANCNGKGWCEDVSYTINTIDRPAVYSFDSLASNSMKSKNPNSGCREVEISKTLDCFDPNPAKNQGGIAIVQQTEAYGFEPGAAQRLNTESRFSKEVSPTLRADMGDNRASVVCLNDQGGSVMGVSENVTGALRAEEHGHQPIIIDEPIPINTMVGTRTTEETRTTFGIGEPGDPEFTISAAHSHAVFAAGFNWKAGEKANSVGYEDEKAPTLSAVNQMGVMTEDVYTMNPRPMSMVCGKDMAATLGADDYKQPQMVYDARGNGDGNTVPTLTGDHQNRITDYTAICLEKVNDGAQEVTGPLMASGYAKNGTQEAPNGMYVMQGFGDYKDSEQASACKARDYKDATDLVVSSFQNTGHGWWNESETGASIRCASGGREANVIAAVDCRHGTENPETNGTLQAKTKGGQSVNYQNVCRTQNTVRRLTPLECERLQGYPDGWTDIEDWIDDKGKARKTTDSARYKALGNSIALPFWFYLLRRISSQYERRATLGSLFDGISGFPLCWERCNGRGTALWTSEIEPFPIAVCKRHFGDEDAGIEGDIGDYL